MADELDNPNPVVYSSETGNHAEKEEHNVVSLADLVTDDEGSEPDEFDASEVFEILRNLADPEHPYTLEQLKVIEKSKITVDNDRQSILVQFTPTIPHCSQATLIGLMIRVKLIHCLPSRFKVDIQISPGSHNSELALNKQLNDKERVAAALENSKLLSVVNKGIASTDNWESIVLSEA
uniref:MIP18 family-like domain-containing protein n=1 Tax=Chromera velia CCMP2878 TaxID=1169474 RepID=A0A0G4HHQ3_9ALVE|mmetsp:Transcript_3093/g.6321  ORF Transcript_3093/g.6321 Transcript_3093/m.6321 type:complete len:179 (-) Transcript_3093:660-1196(-)|eukprot:Cvel_1059.t1-p1 / transcript=Cvel_1059.t1 / gene=Cvel_1059 / organism=Chromera_velia_CCMP2878 / gene_product=MIP18 family protein CG7949, putative / transcript_product=MIP18 family protein CG7949, putative / location=Cvel_scaffold34:111706-114659(+) / protein_length=178 / sequence_SO=supercontig / SO=protein_coding / is_pseudo=false